MNHLSENLNPEQLKAVLHQDGPLLIVAGAGTGKTTVITQRIVYLIEQGKTKPEEILALTFTEKAAGEMAERVESLLPYGYFDLWISTFHGFAERLLKEHGLAMGLPGDFKLLNEFEQWALVRKNLDKFELDYYRPLGNPTKFIHALIKHFSRAKDEDISPRQYLEYAEGRKQNLDGMLSGSMSLRATGGSEAISRTRNLTRDCRVAPSTGLLAMTDEQEVARLNEIANAYHVYQQLLLDNNALDFGDLINYVLKLFRERPLILEKYRRQFKYILLDEFQDTNWAQYELVKMLAAPANNLTVVCDDDQAIYRFRGAAMSNILQFNKDYPEAAKIVLVKNYRSAQNILDLSYEFIKQNNPNRLEWQLNSSVIPAGACPVPRYGEPESRVKRTGQVSGLRVGARNDKFNKLSKKLIAQDDGQGTIEVIQGVDLAKEVKLAVDKIVELKKQDKTATLNDFAILVRANDSANDFMAELDRRGLSYIFGASRGLYAKPVIMDAIAYFKLLDDYHESAALWRILNLPFFDFSERELVELNHLAAKKAWSLYEVLNNSSVLKFDKKLTEKIKPVLALITKHLTLAREKGAVEILQAFLQDSGYLKFLAKNEEQKNLEAINLLNQFLKRLQAFESASDDKSVKAFLAELDLERQAGEPGNLAPDLEAGPEAVRLLTVHGAKGLEFKYIFIANLVDKRFPTIERGEQIELPDALVKEILPVGDIHLEEERRLFYVAMTRAKQGLYFSWAPDYGGKVKKKASRFLVELGLAGKEAVPLNKGDKGGLKFATKKSPPPPFVKGGKIPAHFSYSQLAAYSACPYQYRFAHILKIPTRGKEQFSFGKTLHATLQKLFALINEKKGLAQAELFGGNPPKAPLLKGGREVKISLEEILKLYEQNWIDDWYNDKASKAKRRQQGKDILKVFYEKHKDNWPEALYLEKEFNWKIKGPSAKLGTSGEADYIVRGAIDRIDKYEGGLKLVDYKTGQPKKKLDFTDKEQLLIYQLAAGELFREEIKALSFYYLDDNSEAEFLGSAKDLEKIKVKIIAVIEEIKQGKFPPRASQLCDWCDFNGICEFRN